MPRRRMAGEKLSSTEKSLVRQALVPWEKQLGILKDDNSFNSDLWEGATADGFIQRHDKLRDDLFGMITSGDERSARDVLMGVHNHNLEDANDQIRRIRNAVRYGTVPSRFDLQKLQMSVPQAEADERVSRAALELSGYKNVDSLKGATTKATDIYAEDKDGYEVLVDAQVRGNANGRLNLSLLKDLKLNSEDLNRDFRQLDGNTLLMDYIRTIRDKSRSRDVGGYQSGKEGKLMDTDGPFNDAPTRHFIDNADNLRKDAIISSLRPLIRGVDGQLLPNKDHPRFKANAPSFNPSLPQGWDLLDLDQAREVLSGLKVSDFRGTNRDYDVFFNRSKDGSTTENINIGISQRKLKEMTGNLSPLSSSVYEGLVK